MAEPRTCFHVRIKFNRVLNTWRDQVVASTSGLNTKNSDSGSLKSYELWQQNTLTSWVVWSTAG